MVTADSDLAAADRLADVAWRLAEDYDVDNWLFRSIREREAPMSDEATTPNTPRNIAEEARRGIHLQAQDERQLVDFAASRNVKARIPPSDCAEETQPPLKEMWAARQGLAPFVPQAEKVFVDELLDELEKHYKLNCGRALPQFESHVKPIREAFGDMRAFM